MGRRGAFVGDIQQHVLNTGLFGVGGSIRFKLAGEQHGLLLVNSGGLSWLPQGDTFSNKGRNLLYARLGSRDEAGEWERW